MEERGGAFISGEEEMREWRAKELTTSFFFPPFHSSISQTNQASQTTTLGSWIDRQRLSTIPKNLSADESLRAIKHLTIQLEQETRRYFK